MSLLENFKPFNFNEGVPYVSITINGMTFNKSVIMKLEYPEYVRLLIDEETKRIAVQTMRTRHPKRRRLFITRKRSQMHFLCAGTVAIFLIQFKGSCIGIYLNAVIELMEYYLKKIRPCCLILPRQVN